MPVIGYWLAFLLKDFMSAFDHWIAFGVLLVIGGKMVYEGMDHPETTGEKKQKNSFSLKNILLLAIATSIDALAVGFSYAALNESIVVPALVIAGVTFFLSFLGIEFGRRFGSHFGSRAEIAGGLILVGIGAKILFNHTIGIL